MTSVLIANRGEIAVRICRAAASLGLGTVAVFSREDREATHVRLADEAHPLSGVGVQAYLDAEQLISIARRAGCALIHPGYGFLSENAEFASLCAKAGITFVGPSPELLALFGDKSRTRELAEAHHVPVLRATSGPTSLSEAGDFLSGLDSTAGVMIKALSGGGGRGMRAVLDPEDLAWAYERCRSEAEGAFGNGDVYVEQLLARARHVEVQVIGDGTGQVSVLGERECTVQRRNQKLIEIAPSPTISDQLRQALFQATMAMATSVAYSGLGTFEFLLDVENPDAFYFIETNPRLQVEHTITEAITGIDLVSAQIETATGSSLSDQGLLQDQIPEPRGYAIQSRVNLEAIGADGSARVSTGILTRFEPPAGPGVRVDTHGYPGYDAVATFDSLIAKVVTYSARRDFAAAADQADRALGEFVLAGPGSNIGLLRAILQHPQFTQGELTTTFVEQNLADLVPTEPVEPTPDAATEKATVVAPFAGTVVAVQVSAGDEVRSGDAVAVIEAMKMEHVLVAAASGVVREVLVAVGDTVVDGSPVALLDVTDVAAAVDDEKAQVDLDEIRPDLAGVVERHEIGLDRRRPEAVAKRRLTGQRTARENIADLCDPDSFTEYGALTIAAQRQRRTLDDLIANTPADGLVAGIGQVNSDTFGPEDSRAVVMSYDYTVLAGTQGLLNHKKTDRMLEIAEKRGMPVVLFAEGGGGRPGDTDTTAASALDVTTFTTMGRLSGHVPTVGIASGRCFAGNAALLGCCDVIIATKDATLGMGGPAMIEGGGLGQFRPEEVGPMSIQVPNGVVDILVENEDEAVRVAQTYLSYFQGAVDTWACEDQRKLRHVVPENRVRVYDVHQSIDLLADTGTVLELRSQFGVGIVTALIRIEGQPMGLVANNPHHLGGAIDSDAADKMARFLQLCDAHNLPVVSLCDTPGFMVGPDAERTATVRHFSRLFVTGGNLRIPLCTVVTRKGYGLGAQAMAGGSFRSPVATIAWPTGEVGGMGLEGAVRLGYRRELEAIEDPTARKLASDDLLAEHYERGKATNAAAVFELDDVIDPAQTRRWITASFSGHSARTAGERARSFIDTW